MRHARPVTGALPAHLSRRALLGGGGLLIGFLAAGKAVARVADASSGVFAPSGFVRIGRDGRIVLVMPSTEMGQGIFTAEAALIAEELDVGMDQVEAVAAPVSAAYAQSILKRQVTGGSTSIRAFWLPLREAGATARAMLVDAAADRWGVAADTCTVDRGVVRHARSGRTLPYAALVDDAARRTPPEAIALKPASAFRIIGRSAKRLDTPDKVAGRTIYGIDVSVPGMRTAALAMCPWIGGKVRAVDAAAARAAPGVIDVLVGEDAVAVVADHYWHVRTAVGLLRIDWDRGPNAGLSSETIRAALLDATTPPVSGRLDGDPARAIAAAPTQVESRYDQPYLAHAALEPINTTVHVRADGCDIYVGTQTPQAVAAAAQITGLPPSAIRVHNQMIGGGFGRRLAIDTVRQAIAFATKVDYPLKIVWSREQDIRHDRFRPIYHDRVAAGLDGDGRPVGWTHRVTCSTVLNFALPTPPPPGAPDKDTFAGAIDLPYALPAMSVDWVRTENPVALNWWRGVGHAHNAFVVESFIDELAARAGQDPLDYRLHLVRHDPRSRRVLEIVRAMSGWGRALPRRQGLGLSLHTAFGSWTAMVAHVAVDRLGGIKVHRIFAAIDCGVPINPDSIVAQMQGGTLFGLSAVLFNEITIAAGQVQQSNFHDYRQLRFDEAPPVDVHVVPSDEAPGGVGEVGTVSIAPALANAIAAATGIRLRRLPIDSAALAESDAGSVVPGVAAVAAAALVRGALQS